MLEATTRRKRPTRCCPGMPLKERLEFWTFRVTESGCWIWMAGKYGPTHRYGELKIDGKMEKAHRASWMAHRGLVPEELNVLHVCDVTMCINPDHLFLGTQKENVRDMMNKGRANHPPQTGESNGVALLTKSDVLEIRLSSERICDLAQHYGVARTTIGAVKHRKTWKHIP